MPVVILISIFLLLVAVFPAQALEGKVVSVLDGDTVIVLDENNNQTRVRLASIDAPEKNQPFGMQAKHALSELVYFKNVVVSEDTIDRYGRLIGLIKLNAINVNAMLVEDGYAWVYRKYLNNRDKNFVKLEKIAQEAKRGLWSEHAVPPWEWRRRSSKSTWKTCKSFRTCDEAMQSLFAGNSRLDRDGDGVPCESLCR